VTAGVVAATVVAVSDDGQRPQDANLGARTILLAAAETARSEKTVIPDPKAFVYTRTKERGQAGSSAEGKEHPDWSSFATTREAWLSVDGSRDGAVTPSGSTDLVGIPGFPDDEFPPYRPDLPTTAAGMRAYLYENDNGSRHSDDARAYQAGLDLSRESYLVPRVRAALYEALASIPGVEEVPDAVNIDGVHGVGVTRRDGLSQDELLFDRVTHKVIGERSVFVGDGEGGLRKGTVMYTTAVHEQAIVARVRLRPDGTVRKGPIDWGPGGKEQQLKDMNQG
jgi:hypothetical protein